MLCLYPCYFRDESSSNADVYTVFVRSYAQLVDEALDCFALDGNYATCCEELPENVSEKMKEVGRMIEVLPQVQSLIDRVMDCRPTGVAGRSFLVQIAMKNIIRESFLCYKTFRSEMVLVLDTLFQMPYRSCITAFGIYKKAAIQANQLCEFYDWCKEMGFCGVYEYPFVDKIPQIQIKALEAFLNGMWQMTEGEEEEEEETWSSGLSRSNSVVLESSSTPTLTEDDEDNRQIVVREEAKEGAGWVDFEEKEPLIQFEESENDSWEDLLEASVNLACVPQRKHNEYYDDKHYTQQQKVDHNSGLFASNGENPWTL